MRTFLTVLILVVLLGGGYYWYSQNTAAPMQDSVENPFGDTNTGTTIPEGAVMEDGTIDDSTPAATMKEITVSNSGMTFNPKTLSVKRGDRVKITFNNTGGTHDLRIDSYNVGTKVIQAGQSESFEFVADKAGSFEYYCSVGNHRAMGMKGTLTVTN